MNQPTSDREKLDTRRKALQINIDAQRYGTFAEIGAGQEVVRWFFLVGGAAGTISKSMSAYDMTVSDAIYGKCDRYVSRARLERMLDYEHRLNLERLSESRGENTAFFTFADTVAARSYKKTNECHGWMGVKFQSHPKDQDNQIIIHVRMLDTDAAQQQEALGIVGVNLLYGAFYLYHKPEVLVESLLDNLSIQRIEIDMIDFHGIEFRSVDSRLMSLKLVQLGLSNAAMFAANGAVLQPSEVLHQRPVLVERGSFRPVCHVNLDILRCAYEKFSQEPEVKGQEIVQLMEITMHNLTSGNPEGGIDYRDFLARADTLSACGMTVIISNYFEYYRLAAYLFRFSSHKIGITMGAASLKDLFDTKFYQQLEGGILESFGRLFKYRLKLYVYPYLNKATGELYDTSSLEIPKELRKLYEYLVDQGCIEPLDNYNQEYLPIFSRDILQKIKSKDASWESMVPPIVAEIIKKRGLFGYRK